MTSDNSAGRRWALVAGIVVITLALWLLLDSMGVAVPSLGRFWPIFPLLGGLASIADFFIGSRRPSSLGRGIIATGLALLMFAFIYQVLDWRQVGQWWSAVPLIAGTAFFSSWLVGGRKKPPLLVLGASGIGLGLTGLAPHLDWLERLLPPAAVFWGILLLIVGIYLLWRAFAKRDTN